MTDREKIAYKAGHDAYCSGLPQTDNPYAHSEPHVLEEFQWDLGWTDAASKGQGGHHEFNQGGFF